MRAIRKGTVCFLLTICLMFSMFCPIESVWGFEQVKTSFKAARKTDPEEWNKEEFKVYQFDYNETDLSKYMLTGGFRYYNKNFNSQDRFVKITITGDGVFYLSYSLEGKGSMALYDANKKKLKQLNNDETDYFHSTLVHAGDVFYVKMPTGMKEALIFSCIFKEGFTTLRSGSDYLQMGKGNATYHTFSLTKRSEVDFDIMPFNKKGGTIYAEIQKYINGKWVKIGSAMSIKQTVEFDDDGFIYGLNAGKYRLKLKAKKSQIAAISFYSKSYNKTVAYKKSKAKTIGFGDSKDEIYTAGEQAARWYKVKVNSTKSRRLYYLSSAVTGGFKFTLYQKGKENAIKTTKVMKSDVSIISLPKKKGTYYIKVSKIGKQTNGLYEIEFSN